MKNLREEVPPTPVTPAKAGVVRFNYAKKKIGKILKVLYLARQESCTNHYLKIVISARA